MQSSVSTLYSEVDSVQSSVSTLYAEVDSVQDFLVKGGSGQFICYLEDLGFPEAEHFAWKLLVPRKSLPMPLLFLDPSMILIQHKYGITLFLKDL